LSNCEVSLHGSEVGIIGYSEFIAEAIIAVESLIHGRKFSNVYSRLEREGKKRNRRVRMA
jgi:rRNA processing protein Krr1/Pno1